MNISSNISALVTVITLSHEIFLLDSQNMFIKSFANFRSERLFVFARAHFS